MDNQDSMTRQPAASATGNFCRVEGGVLSHPFDDEPPSPLTQTGANIADARHAIEIAEAYLPPAERDALTRGARRYHALYAIELAEEMIERGSWRSAAAQVREGLRCWPSLRMAGAVTHLVVPAVRRLTTPARAVPSA